MFKSPGEGNYLVRLMNVSLSPTDTVDRMLHTFNCSAYEMDDYNYDNLNKYNLINIDFPVEKRLRWATVKLFDKETLGAFMDKDLERYGIYSYSNPDKNPDSIYVDLTRDPKNPSNIRQAYSIQFTDMVPGDIIVIDYDESKGADQREIVIGATGTYQLERLQPINHVQIKLNKATRGDWQVAERYREVDVTREKVMTNPERYFININHAYRNCKDLIDEG